MWTNAASALMHGEEDGSSQKFSGIWQELHTLSSTGIYNIIMSLQAG